MPSGVYKRTEKHKEISRKGGLNSPTKFKKGHVVIQEIRDKIAKTKNKEIVTNDSYSRQKARKILGIVGYDNCIHHIDHNPLNNNHTNLIVINRSDHSKLHWAVQKQYGK